MLKINNQQQQEIENYYSSNLEIPQLVGWLSRKIIIDFQYCKNIFENLRPSEYNKISLLLVPKELRNDIRVAFSFARYIDDLVDEVSFYLKDATKNRLKELKNEWNESKINNFANHPIINSMRKIAKKHDIPEKYFKSFFSAMKDDIENKSIQSMSDLEDYMYNGSSTLAIIVSYILGAKNDQQIEVAKNIGYAMHLTNILKDIKADYYSIDRVYIPFDILKKFNLEKENIPMSQQTKNWKFLMKFLIKQAETYYKKIELDIHSLPIGSQKIAQVTLKIYKEFLHEIEKNNYDVFSKAIKIPFSKKIKIFVSTVLKNK